jgi:hypothetical protein
VRIVAFVPDLLDRSRLGRLGPHVEVVTTVAALEAALAAAPLPGLVLADLGRTGVLAALATLAGAVPVIGYAPHVEDGTLAEARRAGIEALPRSQFFRRATGLLAATVADGAAPCAEPPGGAGVS